VSDFSVLIPARLASTRLPRKPLLDIAGLPMIVRCCQCAQASGAARVAVATDSPEIVDVVKAHGFEVVLTAADHATGTDRLAEAATLLGLDEQDIVVNLQGDEPLMSADLLRQVAERLARRPDAVMATVVHPIHDLNSFLNPAVVKVVLNAKGDAQWFSRAPLPWPRDAFAQSHILPGIYQQAAQPHSEEGQEPEAWPLPHPPLRHVGLYAYRRHFLPTYSGLAQPASEQAESLEQLRVLHHGYILSCVQVEQAPEGGVDTQEDLIRVRLQIDRKGEVR